MKAGFHAGIYAQAAAADLRSARHPRRAPEPHRAHRAVRGRRATSIGYGFTARIEDVNVDAATRPRPTTRTCTWTRPIRWSRSSTCGSRCTAATRTIRILDEGPRAAFRLPGTTALADDYRRRAARRCTSSSCPTIRLDRLAQLPTEWAQARLRREHAELDAAAHTLPCATRAGRRRPKDGADLHLTGELLDYWDRPYDGAWNLELDGEEPRADAAHVHQVDDGRRQPRRHDRAARAVRRAAARSSSNLHDLDFDVPLSANEEPVRLTLAEVHGGIDLVNDEGYIEKTKALVRAARSPARSMVSATFGLKPLNATRATSTSSSRSTSAGSCRRRSRRSAASSCRASCRSSGDVDDGFELKDFDLALGATPKERAIRVYNGRVFTKDEFDHDRAPEASTSRPAAATR